MIAEELYALAASCLDVLEQHQGNVDALSDDQHTLLAYCYLDSQIEEGGFVQLIASGYGDYVFTNPVADNLRRWGIKATPKIIDKARVLYQEYGHQIEALASDGVDVAELRARFNQFEELDGDYYEVAEEDMIAVCAHVAAHQDAFASAR